MAKVKKPYYKKVLGERSQRSKARIKELKEKIKKEEQIKAKRERERERKHGPRAIEWAEVTPGGSGSPDYPGKKTAAKGKARNKLILRDTAERNRAKLNEGNYFRGKREKEQKEENARKPKTQTVV